MKTAKEWVIMQYDVVDLAMEFLEKPPDVVILQADCRSDLKLIYSYILEKYEKEIIGAQPLYVIYTRHGKITFQNLANPNDHSEGYGNMLFYVPRKNDKTEWIEGYIHKLYRAGMGLE
jgi:hypothetical protein